MFENHRSLLTKLPTIAANQLLTYHRLAVTTDWQPHLSGSVINDRNENRTRESNQKVFAKEKLAREQ